MATSSQDSPRRVNIPKDKPLLFKWFPGDARTYVWLTLAFLGGAFTFLSGLMAGTLVSVVGGFAVWVLCLLAWLFLVAVPAFDGFRHTWLAKRYRKLARRVKNFLGYNTYISDAPETGESWDERILTEEEKEHIRQRKPKVWKAIGNIRVEHRPLRNGSNVGVGVDNLLASHTGTLICAHGSFLSVDDATADEMNQGFARILDAAATTSSPIHRLAFREQTFKGEYFNAYRNYDQMRDRLGLTREDPPGKDVVLAAMNKLGPQSQVRRTTFSLACYNNHIASEVAAMQNGDKSVNGYHEVVYQMMRDFYAQLKGKGSGMSPVGMKPGSSVLTYNDLVMEIRLALDPVFMWQYINSDWPKPDDDQLLHEDLMLPGWADLQRSTTHWYAGSSVHRGFIVREFPQNGMPPDAFYELLKTRTNKTVTTVFEMLPAARGRRLAEAHTNVASDTPGDQEFFQRRRTEAEKVEEETLREHERNVVYHRVGRVRSYVDFFGPSEAEVDADIKLAQDAWLDASFLMDPLAGDEMEAGAHAALPFARGLARFPLPKGF